MTLKFAQIERHCAAEKCINMQKYIRNVIGIQKLNRRPEHDNMPGRWFFLLLAGRLPATVKRCGAARAHAVKCQKQHARLLECGKRA